MNDRLIDILTAAANKINYPSDIWLHLNIETQSWSISNQATSELCVRIDRQDLKKSITQKVNRLSTLLPKSRCYNN